MVAEQIDGERSVFPPHRGVAAMPADVYGEWRDAGDIPAVVTSEGCPAWLVSRYDDVRTVLRSADISTDLHDPDYPFYTPAMRVRLQAGARLPMSNMDPPEHTRYRRVTAFDTGVRHVGANRSWMEAMVDDLISELEQRGDSPLDIVSAFCQEVPSRVICRMLGFPDAGREYFTRLEESLWDDMDDADRLRCQAEMSAYLKTVVEERSSHPGDEFIDHLLAACERGEFDLSDVVESAKLFYSASLPNTTNALAHAIVALIECPAQVEVLLDPATDGAAAVDELLRWSSIVPGLARVATDTIRLRDHVIQRGDGIMLALPAANHDPEAFDDPATLDLRRSGQRSLAFGDGIHQCPGRHIVRVEMDVALRKLFRRFPSISLAGDIEVRIRTGRSHLAVVPVLLGPPVTETE
jgi:pentalenic acid synthase